MVKVDLMNGKYKQRLDKMVIYCMIMDLLNSMTIKSGRIVHFIKLRAKL